MEILKNKIQIDPVAKPKKITATKLSQILGIGNAGAWTTPFQVWCDITKVYRKPFEETKYTEAGKYIEPKQIEWYRTQNGLNNLVTPDDRYGYNRKFVYDFFPEEKIFGGMWDSILIDLKSGDTTHVIECKTAQEKKRKDWDLGVPPDYEVQASLYAYLLGVDDITFITTFLQPEEYDMPNAVKCTEDNTIVTNIKLSQRGNFENEIIKPALLWWKKHIETGISPEFNEYLPGDMEIVNFLKEEEEKKKQPIVEEVKTDWHDLPF